MLSLSTPSPVSARRHSPSPLPLVALLVVLLALLQPASALPTARNIGTIEPLFRRASPQVGPVRSLERLRLRRDLSSVPHGRRNAEVANMKRDEVHVAPVANPKIKRDEVPVVVARAVNPKAKRAAAPAQVVRNPKSKRSLVESSSVGQAINLQRRAAGLPAVVMNPKKRSLDTTTQLSKRAVVQATISVTPTRSGLFERVKRFLAGRAEKDLVRRAPAAAASSTFSSTISRQVGVTRVVPNPKSPKFTSVGSSSSSSAAPSSTTTTRAASSTTTSKPTTTAAPSTTSKASTTTTTTTTSAAPSSTSWPSGPMIAGGYYPDWVEDVMPPEAVNYKLFDLINYSFAIPTSDDNIQISSYSAGILQRVVKLAHAANTKVVIAIGGWSDSGYFSGAVSTSSRRKTFVNNIVAFVNKYDLDGVDIDWEYPGTQGAGSNEVSTSDTANLLSFLKLLRSSLPNKRLSTCTTQQTYIGANGSPIGDVSAYAQYLDAILVMNYDVWGASSTPGPNAPLENACTNSLQPTANMLSAIQTWEKAGMPASKILMGIPAYGYVSSSSATSLIHKRDGVPATGLSNRHLANLAHDARSMSEGHKWFVDGQRKAAERRAVRERAAKRGARKERAEQLARRGSPIVCPNNHSGKPCPGVTGQNISEINWNPLASSGSSGSSNSSTGGDGVFVPGNGPGKVGTGDLSGLSGNQIQFADMINYGVVVKDTTTLEWVGANGYTRAWDTCSSTPYLYDTSRKVVITYDDPHSLGLKGQLAAQQGIGGMAMWDISGDTLDFQLTQSWRSSMGLNPLGYR
ncbi:Chitinase [Rhodotorula toruloides]|uniref:Glycoside hydrolase superfamily n=1 Tax=Rhodotorula toruloides TaxID=5286 RepID=A0A2T0AAC6_RHOTO|nr:Chitinase [Rhodotorula toruloides]PRQ74942.1 Glycoside hydrolase superfamily [Rhodotorula toruloides]